MSLPRAGCAREVVVPNPKAKLLDQVREVMRLRHYSIRTEQSYCDWRLDTKICSVSQNAFAGGVVARYGEGRAVFERFGSQWPSSGLDAESSIQRSAVPL